MFTSCLSGLRTESAWTGRAAGPRDWEGCWAISPRRRAQPLRHVCVRCAHVCKDRRLQIGHVCRMHRTRKIWNNGTLPRFVFTSVFPFVKTGNRADGFERSHFLQSGFRICSPEALAIGNLTSIFDVCDFELLSDSHVCKETTASFPPFTFFANVSSMPFTPYWTSSARFFISRIVTFSPSTCVHLAGP